MEGFEYQEEIKKYSISEVADMMNVHQQTIRKWCNDYSEHVIVPRDESNHRYFTDEILEVLKFIKMLKDKGENIHVIKKVLANSKGVEEIKEQSLELTEVGKMTGEQLKELMFKHFSGMMLTREEELKAEFETKLEQVKDEILEKQQEQIQSENKKLIDYIAVSKEEEKKGFWNRLFGRD